MTMHKVARSVARRMARKCWWADVEDLQQEALLEMLKARPRFDPRVGVPLEAFLRKAAYDAVGRALLKSSAPVSASWHKMKELVGLHRAAVDINEADLQPWADTVLAQKEWTVRTRKRLAKILQRHMEETDAAMVLRVVLNEEAPKKVAADNSVAPARVYALRRKASLLILQDWQCYHLWKEIPR